MTSEFKNKNNYITPDTEAGRYALKYLHQTCEEALTYCQENGLESFEDFATQVELIAQKKAQSKGEVALIKAEVKGNGLVLKMPNLTSATTTGKMMMKHLGCDEKLENKFTRQGIESMLKQKDVDYSNNLQTLKSLSQDKDGFYPTERISPKLENIDELIEPTASSKANTNNLDFDDFDFIETNSKTNNTKQIDKPNNINTSSQKPRLNSDDNQNLKTKTQEDKTKKIQISKIFNDFGEDMVNTSKDFDGLGISGLGMQGASLLAMLVNNLMKSDRHQEAEALAKTIERLQKAQERADRITSKTSKLEENIERDNNLSDNLESTTEREEIDFDKFTTNNEEIKEDNFSIDLENKQNNHQDRTGEILTETVNKLDRQISKVKGSKSQPITIDKNVSLQEQLKQINAALDRIENRLDDLEKRIEALEKAVAQQNQEAKQFADNLLKLYRLEEDWVSITGAEPISNTSVSEEENFTAAEFKIDNTDKTIRIHADNETKQTALGLFDRDRNLLFSAKLDGEEWQICSDRFDGKSVAQDWLDSAIARNNQQKTSEGINNQTEDFEVDSSDRSDSEKLSVECAKVLLETSQLQTKLDEVNGRTSKDGIPISDNIKLYTYTSSDSITVTIEEENLDTEGNLETEELFSATKFDREWEINVDRLEDNDKQEIIAEFTSEIERAKEHLNKLESSSKSKERAIDNSQV